MAIFVTGYWLLSPLEGGRRVFFPTPFHGGCGLIAYCQSTCNNKLRYLINDYNLYSYESEDTKIYKITCIYK
jgi:hypothetical protein